MKSIQGWCSAVTLVCLLFLVVRVMIKAQNSDNLIVFMSDRDGNREIYIMDEATGEAQRLTTNDAEDTQPIWSPDKSRIAFASNRDDHFALYVMNPDGSNQQPLLSNEFVYYEYPAWSPDGEYIAYASDEAGSLDIYIIDVNGSHTPQQLTTAETEETEPAWSPDGRHIAYIGQLTDGAFEVFTVSPQSDNPQQLTQSRGGTCFSPRWSSDGSRLAYALTRFDQSGNISEIYVRDLSTGDENLLISRENSYIQGLSWSENGDALWINQLEVA